MAPAEGPPPLIEVSVDRDLCMGAGECVYYAPNTFRLDDDDRSTVVDPLGDQVETVVAAACSCPNFSVAVTRDGRSLL